MDARPFKIFEFEWGQGARQSDANYLAIYE